jgi:hypothetical protein
MDHHNRKLVRVERQVPGLPDKEKPDLVIINEANKTAAIIDVTCPFESRSPALHSAREHKKAKYQHLADQLRERGLTVTCDAVVVGSLGTWDPANQRALVALGIPAYKHKVVAKKSVTSTIRWSRDMYVEHISGTRQYSADVRLPRPT